VAGLDQIDWQIC